MSESERIFSSAQVGKLLDLSSGMVRRYSLALERLTGESIPQDPRDGRQFSQRHVELLIAARRFVMGNRGMSVEQGFRLALGLAEEPGAAPLASSGIVGGGEAAEAFRAALREYAEPLLTELRTLSDSNARLAEEVAELRGEVAGLKALPAAVETADTEPVKPVRVVEPQRSEHQSWVSETTERGDGLGVRRRPTDGGEEEGVFVWMAKRLERILGRR